MRLLLFLLFFYNVHICAQNFDAQYLKHNTIVEFDGKDIIETVSNELLILNPRGTKYAEFNIPFQEGNPVKQLEAVICDASGNEIRKLSKKEISTKSAWMGYEFYTDHRILNFKLIHNRFPYVIKYSYSKKIKDFIFLTYWQPTYRENIKIANASLSLSIPNNCKINVFSQKVSEPFIDSTEETIQYTWKIDNYCPVKTETFSPRLHETSPCVKVIPQTFHYGINGNSTSWESLGKWESQLINGLDVLTPQEAAKVHQLTDSIQSTKEKVRVLYHYMQDNTRYILVSEENGGLIPHPATYVCQNKYGDCKALTNYMKALLKEAGISAHYTTIYAGEKPVRLNTEFPSSQFNHVILQVPLTSDTVWLECTSKNGPFNYLGSFTQNRLALIINNDSSKLIKTPACSLNDVLEAFHTTINLSTLNDSISFISNSYIKGKTFDELSGFDNQLSEKDKKKYINYFGIGEKSEVLDFSINRLNRDSCFVNLDLKGRLNGIVEKLGPDDILIKPFKPLYFDLKKPEERNSDIFISYPINKCDTTEFHFNGEISSVKGLYKVSIENKFGTYKKDFTIENNKLTTIKSFQLNQNAYTKDDYPDLYAFLTAVLSAENMPVIVKSVNP